MCLLVGEDGSVSGGKAAASGSECRGRRRASLRGNVYRKITFPYRERTSVAGGRSESGPCDA